MIISFINICSHNNHRLQVYQQGGSQRTIYIYSYKSPTNKMLSQYSFYESYSQIFLAQILFSNVNIRLYNTNSCTSEKLTYTRDYKQIVIDIDSMKSYGNLLPKYIVTYIQTNLQLISGPKNPFTCK